MNNNSAKENTYTFEYIEIIHAKEKINLIFDGAIPALPFIKKSVPINFYDWDSIVTARFFDCLRMSFFKKISEDVASNSLGTYSKKIRELLRLIKRCKPSGSAPIDDIFTHKSISNEFICWAGKNCNMKVVLFSTKINGYGLWGDDFSVAVKKAFKTKPKSIAAILFNPNEGAFTQTEINDISFGICKLYEAGELNDMVFVSYWLALILGLRAEQFRRLLVDDFDFIESESVYYFNVDKLKQRGLLKTPKSLLRMPPLLNELLKEHLTNCNERKRSYVLHRTTRFNSAQQSSNAEISTWPDEPYEDHLFQTLGQRLLHLGIYCKRLPGKVPYSINCLRFKHTMLTNAAINGATPHELAALAMHNSLKSAQSYIDSIPEAQALIKKEVGPIMLGIAKQFTDVFYEGGYFEAAEKCPERIKRHYGIAKGKPAGVCSTGIDCTLLAPIACLICEKFQPFVDAPFGDIKEYIIEQQEAEHDIRIKNVFNEYIIACDTWDSRRKEETI